MEGSSRVNETPNSDIKIPINEEEKRHCWVCFCTDEDDPNALWVHPCTCKGTSKWVHQLCLQRWIDEKQKGNPIGKVSCPQCNTEYIIVYPDMGKQTKKQLQKFKSLMCLLIFFPIILGRFIVILDSVNAIIYRVCPVLAAGITVISIYWVAVTYGGITVIQVNIMLLFF